MHSRCKFTFLYDNNFESLKKSILYIECQTDIILLIKWEKNIPSFFIYKQDENKEIKYALIDNFDLILKGKNLLKKDGIFSIELVLNLETMYFNICYKNKSLMIKKKSVNININFSIFYFISFIQNVVIN